MANISLWCAALLRQAVFNTVPGTVNVRRGAAAQKPTLSSEEGKAGILKDMVDQLPHKPDTPIVGRQKVQFMEPIHQASTPMVGGNVPSKIGMSYVGPEPVKLAEASVYHPGPRPVPRLRKSQSGLKHSVTEAVEHSLQVAAWEFKEIHEPKISKLKGHYLAIAALIFST